MIAEKKEAEVENN